MATRFFDEAGLARIRAAVEAAERKSKGEIVPVVIDRSDAYPEARDRAALLGLAVATAVAVLVDYEYGHAFQMGWLVPAQVLGWLAGFALGGVPAVARVVLGKRTLAAVARERAEIAFREHGLTRTKEGTGVLLFASLFEHQVVVLADKPLHDKVGAQAWDEAVRDLVSGIRAGDPAGGFVTAIEHIGERLAAAVPRTAGDDVNELPDSLRIT